MSNNKKRYIVVAIRPWNEKIFKERISKFLGAWKLINDPEALRYEAIKEFNPRYIFFIHWSIKVPEEITDNFECVCFHMTDVPYGRGGSPLQNLIIRGHRETKITALGMTEDFDAGPIYLKEDLSLEGLAEEIYIRAAELIADMISEIIKDEPIPKPQKGTSVIFKRRKPEESELPVCKSLRELFDFIRMLDAEGYPHAFIKCKGFLFEFSRPSLHHDSILADVKIKKIEETNK